ncbi:hypothetical protein OPT61_g1942 [Boeremia exigua]|uniref:Uncharacterized protein n=1 Tax=Boeremia exigua TaxID=749465 RepID=A0ACC2INC0_9PLEO|nr:hypothetical protein OPT61_g1942 [Boeremia exigua]
MSTQLSIRLTARQSTRTERSWLSGKPQHRDKVQLRCWGTCSIKRQPAVFEERLAPVSDAKAQKRWIQERAGRQRTIHGDTMRGIRRQAIKQATATMESKPMPRYSDLNHDFSECRHVALKLYIESNFVGGEKDNELNVYKRIEESSKDHPGRHAVRSLLDSFDVNGPNGRHRCLVHPPLWESILDLDIVTPKQLNGRTIYLSRGLSTPKDFGAPILCDLGSAVRLDDGVECREDIQPNIYRAPEIILDVPWTCSVDIWNVGCMTYRGRAHLAEMIALLGPPPPGLLAQANLRSRFFSVTGEFCAGNPYQNQHRLRTGKCASREKTKIAFYSSCERCYSGNQRSEALLRSWQKMNGYSSTLHEVGNNVMTLACSMSQKYENPEIMLYIVHEDVDVHAITVGGRKSWNAEHSNSCSTTPEAKAVATPEPLVNHRVAPGLHKLDVIIGFLRFESTYAKDVRWNLLHVQESGKLPLRIKYADFRLQIYAFWYSRAADL